jgi:ankyrin repeat protein
MGDGERPRYHRLWRIARALALGLCLLSALVCVTAAVLWSSGCLVSPSISWVPSQTHYEARSWRGQLLLYRFPVWYPQHGVLCGIEGLKDVHPKWTWFANETDWRITSHSDLAGFETASGTLWLRFSLEYWHRQMPFDMIGLPYWFLVVLTGLFPACWIIHGIRQRRRGAVDAVAVGQVKKRTQLTIAAACVLVIALGAWHGLCWRAAQPAYPLNFAIECGDLPAVTELLAEGADVNQPDEDGWRPLHHAARRGVDFVRPLLEKGADPNLQNGAGVTPLCFACLRSFPFDDPPGPACVKLLLKHGAKLDAVGNRELLFAARSGGSDIVSILLDAGADVNAKNGEGETAISEAVFHKDRRIMELLLSRGADVPQAGPRLLMNAARGDANVVKLLIAKGAKADAIGPSGLTALHWAANREIAEILLAHGAAADPKDEWGRTPLLLACQREDGAPVVAFLLEHDADITAREPNGRGALDMACDFGYPQTVGVLLSKHADPNTIDIDGRTPLHVIAEKPCFDDSHDDVKIAAMLIAAGADVNARTKLGWTPLHVAANEGKRDIAEYLLDHGADIGALDHEQRTPLDLAKHPPHRPRPWKPKREEERQKLTELLQLRAAATMRSTR